MKFGRSSTSHDEHDSKKAIPIRLPIMKRHRQPAQDVKENIPPEDGGMHDSVVSSPKASRRKTVIDFFKHMGNHKGDEESDNILTRMTPQKSKTRKHARSTSSYEFNDGVLDRILGPTKDQEKKRASEQFYLKQQVRADSRNASGSNAPPPFYTTGQSEPDRGLTEEEIFLMFEGAPCFSIVEDKAGPRPQIVFHGGSAGIPPGYAPDFKAQEHESFSACTLGVHHVRESDDIPFTSHLRIDKKSGVAGNGILELPSMLSAKGVEPGTVGFEHFLQLPVADSLMAPDEAATFNDRHLLVSNPADLGLREFDLSQLVDFLTEAGNIYTHLANEHSMTQLAEEERILEMGESLFGKLLTANSDTTEDRSELSLDTQIATLQRVLERKGLWHDFSLVEWRIRVGQLLWTDLDADYLNSGDSVHHLSERDVFMLQITLSAELLLRLKVLELLRKEDTTQQQSPHKRSVKLEWDLLLAERFLMNMSVSVLPNGKEQESGIRSSFFSAISFFAAESDPEDLATQPILRPKNEDEQIDGLMAFARTLSWPHAEEVYAQLRPQPDGEGNERPVSMVSIYATPLNSPRLFSADDAPGTRTSYFGALARQQQQKRPNMNRTATTQSMQLRPAGNETDGFNVGGWLSRSWLSGLVLPGEPASHFLISTLLENSPKAISVLGDSADLYGGFVYEGRTFWSKSSAVARVLAASPGAVECMGWISVPSTPTGCSEGWVTAKVDDFPYSSAQPRIKSREALSRTSDPFHGAETSRLRSNDFTTPVDSPPVMGNEVVSHGLSFSEPDSDPSASPSPSSASMEEPTAHLTFSSPINAKLPRVTVPLTYDIHFISSQPCYPVPPASEAAESVSSSPSENLALSFSTSSIADTPPPAHPLHTSYRYMTLPVAMLLSVETRSRALSLPDPTAEAEAEEEEEVAVLDCRGKADLELLARAWCAKVGENAIVGRVGRTCLACCIREARGLGVRVVIRT